jgi:hypothetical protein
MVIPIATAIAWYILFTTVLDTCVEGDATVAAAAADDTPGSTIRTPTPSSRIWNRFSSLNGLNFRLYHSSTIKNKLYFIQGHTAS